LQQDLQLCMQRLEAQIMPHPYWWWDVKRDDLVERLAANNESAMGNTGEG
jgi:hypothetical protein